MVQIGQINKDGTIHYTNFLNIVWEFYQPQDPKMHYTKGGTRIAETTLDNGVYISTVFLPICYSPYCFETMIFNDPKNKGYGVRYQTLQEAMEGHTVIVSKLLKNESLNQE